MRSAALAVFALFGAVSAQAVTIDFEGLPSMTFITGTPIPDSAKLSDQFLSTLGVRFASGSDYVPVIALGDIPNHAPSGANGIGGSTDTGLLTYNDGFPITISFWDPSNPLLPATTDFVSIRGDLRGSSFTVAFEAFDIDGNLLAVDSGQDIGGRTYSVTAASIHMVRFSGVPTPTIGGSGGVGLDDLTFNPVTPLAVPEPGTLVLIGTGTPGKVREADEGTVPSSSTRFKEAPVGTGGDSPQAGLAGLLFFELPDLATHPQITSAELTVELTDARDQKVSGQVPGSFNVDLYFLGLRTARVIESVDYGDGAILPPGATLIQDNWWVANDDSQIGTSKSIAVDSEIQSAYTDGTPNDAFVVFALYGDIDFLGNKFTTFVFESQGAKPDLKITATPDPSPDRDGDETADRFDNCPDDFNADQADTDENGIGDVCNDFEDLDGDEWADSLDNCSNDFDPTQADQDEDGIGDLCDPFPNDPDNNLAQCSSDLGDCQIDVISCEADAAQCSTDLSQAQTAVITCNGDLSSCIGTATQLEADLVQTQGALVQTQTDLSQAQADITVLQADLAATEDSLAEAVADSDADGVRDTADACPGTIADSELDLVGCSQPQFCSAIDASTGPGRATCNNSDWMNDEPLAENPEDCKAKQGLCEALSLG